MFYGDFMKINIINACSDLGVDVDGSNKGPLLISKNLNSDKINEIITLNKQNIKKSKDENDLKKNLSAVNDFNNRLYDKIIYTLNDNAFPITIGGDHSIAIGSALGSKKINKNIGIIWIDAHLDYNTFETTITGNLHGLPLAALNGICKDLTKFYDDEYYNPKNTVVVGYRSDEINKEDELNNIKKMGVSVFTCEDINRLGIDKVLNEAIKIATNNTSGMHISYDLDVIDPKIAPGVSVPEINGINLEIVKKTIDILIKNIDNIKSFDLVEFNPDNDINNKTLNIALNILNNIIEKK